MSFNVIIGTGHYIIRYISSLYPSRVEREMSKNENIRPIRMAAEPAKDIPISRRVPVVWD